MFVISPADELLLMTYGAASIPRIAPRPTLDCLPNPKVPIEFPSYFKTEKDYPHIIPIINKTSKSCYNFWSKDSIPNDTYQVVEIPKIETKTIETTTELSPVTPTYEFISTPNIFKHHSPISDRRESRNTPGICFSNTPTLVHEEQSTLPQLPLQLIYDYNKAIMQQQNQQQNDKLGVGLGGTHSFDYNALDQRRSPSPSILVEPATPTKFTDPTQPLFGPGWGRPMSPMDLPSELSKSPTVSNKSRLRPKLHIPLGRLGRSTSSEYRESNRLREDLHLQVENPIFNSENLRQRNFDAFFESGEPVYKLHPKTPTSAPGDSSSIGSYSPSDLDKCAGVYDSALRGHDPSGHGKDLFERSADEKCMNLGSKIPEMASRSRRAKSVCNDSGGVPQKGDRCPENFFFIA